MKITSLTNSRVKNVVRMRQAAGRRKEGLIIVEGWREVVRANEAGVEIKEVFYCPELGEGNSDLVARLESRVGEKDFFVVTTEVYSKLAFGDRREGILVVARPPQWTFGKLKLKKNSLLVVVEGVEKPGNLGAILRSCDAAGVDALIVGDPATDVYNPNCIRASLGTVFSMPVVAATSKETIDFLRDKKVKIVAALPAAKTLYTKVSYQEATAIVVGSEEKGLAGVWQTAAGEQVCIPMNGKADSLNVSVAAAVMVFEALRQRAG
jgi:RNA methyltransferase, TrmH family